MKTQNKFNDRLIKFAKHLDTIQNHYEFGLYQTVNLIELAKKRNLTLMVTYHEWAFAELPAIFDEWYFDANFGRPLFEGCIPEEGSVGAVIDFFNLRMEEFCHLFDLEGFQNVERFGGGFLNFESDGPDIARNIFELVKRRNNGLKS